MAMIRKQNQNHRCCPSSSGGLLLRMYVLLALLTISITTRRQNSMFVNSFFWNDNNNNVEKASLSMTSCELDSDYVEIEPDVLYMRHAIYSETNDEQTVTIELTYHGIGWIGFAFTSRSFSMIPSVAMIGLPANNTIYNGVPHVGKYHMTEKNESGVQLTRTIGSTFGDADTDANEIGIIDQNDTHTVLTFTRRVTAQEVDEVEVMPDKNNRFIWAVGHDNDLKQHKSRGSSRVDLNKVCDGTSTGGNNTLATNDTIYVGMYTSEEDGVSIFIESNVHDETITIEMIYSGTGDDKNPMAWIGFGFPQTPNTMIGSMAVLALQEAGGFLKKFDLLSKDSGSDTAITRAPESRQNTLFNPIYQQNTTHTYMKFTKPLLEANEPTVMIGTGVVNNFIYAIGFTNDLGQHKKHASFAITLEPCFVNGISIGDGNSTCTVGIGNMTSDMQSPPTDDKNQKNKRNASPRGKWKAHGILMSLAWVILIPTAIMSSIFQDSYSKKTDLWFQIHRNLNMIAIIVTMIGFVIAVSALRDEGGSYGTEKHHKIGVVIFLFTILQGIGGLFRPSVPKSESDGNNTSSESDKQLSIANLSQYIGSNGEIVTDDDDNTTVAFGRDYSRKIQLPCRGIRQDNDGDKSHPKKSMARFVWEIIHRVMGAVILFLAWSNCNSGIVLYASRYNVDMSGAIWGIIGGWIGLCIFLFLYQCCYLKWNCTRLGSNR